MSKQFIIALLVIALFITGAITVTRLYKDLNEANETISELKKEIFKFKYIDKHETIRTADFVLMDFYMKQRSDEFAYVVTLEYEFDRRQEAYAFRNKWYPPGGNGWRRRKYK